MKNKKDYRGDPYKKVRYCDPGACHCCENQGSGNFYCRFLKALVVKNWDNTAESMKCKQLEAGRKRGAEG